MLNFYFNFLRLPTASAACLTAYSTDYVRYRVGDENENDVDDDGGGGRGGGYSKAWHPAARWKIDKSQETQQL